MGAGRSDANELRVGATTMMPTPIQLAKYDNSSYKPGGTFLKRTAWFFLGLPILRSAWIPFSGLRVGLLRVFGASIGTGVVIKPSVVVKYPWHLRVEDDCWIGEHVWIDNLTTVRLGSNVCVSQGAYFCTGNHDWTDPQFGLRVAPIEISAGAWVGAKTLLTPGVVLGEGAVAAAGSVVTGPIPAFEIHAGNPAQFVKTRTIRSVIAVQENPLGSTSAAEIKSPPEVDEKLRRNPAVAPSALSDRDSSTAAPSWCGW